jgi:hypothetical protein
MKKIELTEKNIFEIGEILEKEFGQCLSWSFGFCGDDYCSEEMIQSNKNLALVINRFLKGDKSFIENYKKNPNFKGY